MKVIHKQTGIVLTVYGTDPSQRHPAFLVYFEGEWRYMSANLFEPYEREGDGEMSRTIKFRGKRVDNGEWVEGYFVRLRNPLTNEYSYWIYSGCCSSPRGVIPESVVQFTGLHDKNGKEIYEGESADIKLSGGLNVVAKVEWIDGVFCWVASGFCVSIKEVVFNLRNSNVEVVNPSLLEVQP